VAVGANFKMDTKIYREINPLDKRNVVDQYKGLTNEEIKKKNQENSLPVSILMMNIIGDFNFATIIRNANAIGARHIYYFGNKKFDRRGCVGAYHYIDITHLKSIGDLWNLKNKYSFVALEQTKSSIDLASFKWNTNKTPLILVGEEGCGLDQDIVDMCEVAIEIKQRGSVRSLNAATAASIAMFDYASKKG